VVAADLDDPGLSDGRFGYDFIDTAQPSLDTDHANYPVERFTQVAPYGVDYIYLQGDVDLTLDFYGDTRARLLDTGSHSGDHLWYANRGDDSNMRLTRAFDLSGLTQATLQFWTWYDIETDWDYGYVVVSNDDGATWQILRGPNTTDTNPNGNSYGWAYTGRSGDVPVWIQEGVDLSAYAGQQILLRFEYVTDDALNYPGWAIDDIAIPELAFLDDGEEGRSWRAQGFQRLTAPLDQRFIVQVIEMGETTSVRRLPLDAANRGEVRLSGFGSTLDKAIIFVAAASDDTRQTASYGYTLRAAQP
jgi:immune inhibitor A